MDVPDPWKDSFWIPGHDIGQPGRIVRNPNVPSPLEVEGKGWHGRLRGTFRKRSDGNPPPMNDAHTDTEA
jgi:hypothetical protein